MPPGPLADVLLDERWQADFEKTLLRFENTPQPKITAIKLDVDLHPHEQRVDTKGVYTLENRSGDLGRLTAYYAEMLAHESSYYIGGPLLRHEAWRRFLQGLLIRYGATRRQSRIGRHHHVFLLAGEQCAGGRVVTGARLSGTQEAGASAEH